VAAGFFYGLSVHFKLYPIIYGLVLYFYIDRKRSDSFLRKLFTRDRLIFGITSAATFLGVSAYFYHLYGYEFIYESYLYHFARKDNRHNFSIYWYIMYYTYDQPQSTIVSILTFLPQWTLSTLVGIFLYSDLFFALFMQTFMFTTFNKVFTMQYCLWYLIFVPLFARNSTMRRPKFVFLIAFWGISAGLWGLPAYLFEFKGWNTFGWIAYGSILFFIANMAVAVHALRD